MSADTLDRLSEKVSKILGMLGQLDQYAGGPARSGGSGSGGSGVMGGSLAGFSTPLSSGKVQLGLGIAQGAVSGLAGVAGGVATMLPDVGSTVAMMNGYYTAGAMTGGSMSAGRMKNILAGSMGTISDVNARADVAALLTARGMNLGSMSAMATMSAASGATKYLNIPTVAAAAGLERMTSGQGSSRLSRMGIFTSEFGSGNTKNPTQIFEDLYQRFTYGRGKMSTEDMMDSMRKGFLGENIAGLGFDAATETQFKAFMLAKTQGRTLDFSDPNSVNAAMAANEAQGYENPFLSQYKLNSAEARNQETASQPYLAGIKDATNALVELKNFTNDQLIPTFGQFNAAMQTFLGNNSGAGLVGGIAGGINGLMQMGGAYLGYKGAKGLLGAMGKGGATGAKGAAKPPKGGFVDMKGASGLLKGASKFVKGGAILSVAGGAIDAMTGADDNPWDNWESFAGGAVVGGIAGAPAGGVGAIPGAAIGGTIGYLGNVAGYYGAKLFGAGGPSSSVGTGGTTDTGTSFIQPTAGPVTASYGQKGSIWSKGYHSGTDYGVPIGTPVYAAASGTVSKAQKGSGSHSYGLYLVIEHGGGYETLYGHLSQTIAKPGDTVTKGQLIAKSGASGHVTGPHLHFEVFRNGVSVDPGTLQAFVGDPADAKKGAKAGDSTQNGNSGNSVLDTVLGVGRTAGLPITTGMSGVKGQYEGTMERVGSGLRRGAASLYAPVSAATGMVASVGATGGPSSEISLGGTTDTSGGLQLLQQSQVTTSPLRTGRSGGNQVTIHVNIAKANESEAKRFAHMVKTILEDEKAIKAIGSR